MIKVTSGLPFQPVGESYPANSLAVSPLAEKRGARGLKELQTADSFFSPDSASARLSAFLRTRPDDRKPLQFTYATAAGYHPIWDKLFPNSVKTVITLSPLALPKSSTEKELKPGTLLTNSPQRVSDYLAQTSAMQLQFGKSDKPNPFIQTGTAKTPYPSPVFDTADVLPEPGTTRKKKLFATRITAGGKHAQKPQSIRFQTIRGTLLPPSHNADLKRAFTTANRLTDVPAWTVYSDSGYQLLPPDKPPESLGYTRKLSRAQTFARTVVGHGAEFLLGLRMNSTFVELPNGAQWALTPNQWISPDNRPVKLLRVVELPNGNWLSVNSVEATKVVTADRNQTLRSLVDHWVNRLESGGQTREAI